MWQLLTANLAVVALVVSSWSHAQHWLDGRHKLVRTLAFSLFMAAGTLGSMLLGVELAAGVFLDLRSSLISTASLFGGPVGAVVVAGACALYRAWLGGSGMWIGLTGVAVAALVGLAAHWRMGPLPSVLQLVGFAAAVGLATALNSILPIYGFRGSADPWFRLATIGLNCSATFIAALVIAQGRKWAMERSLLKAAFLQAPDFQYIKDREGRFVAVNLTVAGHHGFADPGRMRGMTDRDVAPAARAEALMAMERRLLSTGEPIRDHVDEAEDPVCGRRWYSTSKSAIRDAGGAIVGLAGVTHDITVRKRLQEELKAKNDQLDFALQEMSEGVAMFDGNGYLVLSNERYRDFFPLTAHVRTPGTHLSTMLAASAETGEQKNIPTDGLESWIKAVVDSLKTEGDQEIQLHDDRWMRIRTRPTSEGTAMVVVSEITGEKEAEVEAASLTDQLRRLAGTDALTGLLNRRAFDQVLEGELTRSERDRRPVSLLLVDVDHFKAYNDTYGHLAGDDCLRSIGQCLVHSTRRGGDTVARYGGEEFAVVLASTTEENARQVADKLRNSVRDLDLLHEGSDKRAVTISIGVCTVRAAEQAIRPADLISRADAALYQAKAGGRDRVESWTEERSPRSAMPRRLAR